MQTDDEEQGARARADLLIALVLVALGLTVFYLSYTMPRLEARRVHPATIPGLVPMALGIALVALSGLLAWRSSRILAPGGWRALLHALGSMVAVRAVAAMALVLVFTVFLVGWLPFWAASMVFIFVFVVTFEVFLAEKPQPPGRSAVWASITAVVFGGAIYLAFTKIFLVRLP